MLLLLGRVPEVKLNISVGPTPVWAYMDNGIKFFSFFLLIKLIILFCIIFASFSEYI